MLGFAIAISGLGLAVLAGASYPRRVGDARPFTSHGAARAVGEPGTADAVANLVKWGCDGDLIRGALRGDRQPGPALAEVNLALGEVDFALSSGRAAAAAGVRLALAAGVLGGVVEVIGGGWQRAAAAVGVGLVGGGLAWELLRRGDGSARLARTEWDRVAAALEKRLFPSGAGRPGGAG